MTLPAPAGVGGALLALSSSNPAVATVPATVLVPQGAISVAFPVVTFPVAYTTSVTITAFRTDPGGGIAALATLLVLPGTPVASPGTPVALTARPLSPGQIELAWLDTSANELAFEIHRRTSAGDWVWIALVAPNTTRFTDYVIAGVTYSYRVRAQSARGVSAWSNEAAALAP